MLGRLLIDTRELTPYDLLQLIHYLLGASLVGHRLNIVALSVVPKIENLHSYTDKHQSAKAGNCQFKAKECPDG